MAIEYKDYYETLGVTREAGDDEVRRAFRKLARVYHPDKNGNNPDAEDRFKEINEAYEVLGDPSRRRRYDEFNDAWAGHPSADEAWKNFANPETSSSSAGSHHFTFTGAGFSEFFDQLFNERRVPVPEQKSPARPEFNAETVGRGEDLEVDLRVTLEEVAHGAVRPINMKRRVRCETCLGMGQHSSHPCAKCKGHGHFLHNDTFKVKIPRGVREGAALRIPGKGENGLAGADPGDLYLKIQLSRHPEFRLENDHLVLDLELAPWEAVLGATVPVPTLDGGASIKIPAGTQNGRKLRLRGRGLPRAEGDHGDLIIQVKIQVPESPRDQERALWERLAAESAFNPRDN